MTLSSSWLIDLDGNVRRAEDPPEAMRRRYRRVKRTCIVCRCKFRGRSDRRFCTEACSRAFRGES